MPAPGTGRPTRAPALRTWTGWALGAVGLAAYNWWVAVAGDRTLMQSPDELFSDLEAVGRPHAQLLSDLDVVSGTAILAALLLVGRPRDGGRRRREWWLLVVFACAAAVGGLFPYLCPEGLSASCRAAEWGLTLPWRHYVHVLAGIVEFAAVTATAVLTWRRTRDHAGVRPLVSRVVVRVLLVGYPLLGLTYLSGHLGAFVEPVFLVTFSAVVAVELSAPR